MLAIQQDPTPDLNPDTLGALSQLMLAQAQQVFVHKAIHGKYLDVFFLYKNSNIDFYQWNGCQNVCKTTLNANA